MAKKKKAKAKRPPPPGFVYRGEDARTTFDKLRFEAEAAGAGRVDVTGIYFPKADAILGELRYQFDGTDWAAVVTKDTDSDGGPVFRLWYQRGDRFQKSGVFPDGGRLVSYIRQAAREKFEGFTPSVDTLDKIKHKSALSMVPECFQVGVDPGLLASGHCRMCPYREECHPRWLTDGSESQASKMVEGPLVLDAPEEPEGVFMARLRSKVRKQDWED